MSLYELLLKNTHQFAPLVPFEPSIHRLLSIDLSKNNTALTASVYGNIASFSDFIQQKMSAAEATYAIGGYLEHRAIYCLSKVFDGAEPRSIHLGIDIWGAENTPIYAPMDGIIHSVGFHPDNGNYGCVIILQHQLEQYTFYTLYGHLRQQDAHWLEGEKVEKGTQVGALGNETENGHWPPHVHFQVIHQLGSYFGDYPGVCAPSQQSYFAYNCPNAALMSGFFDQIP